MAGDTRDSANPFYRLAPFIREYIYAHGWTELRAVQVEAARALFETDTHLLLATGTASGKTEAAFLPVLTLMQESPPRSVGALYVGPTKALINDQFYRLTGLLEEAQMPVWHWHGDVSRTEKMRLLRHPRGVLQITPESLESLLLNRRAESFLLFSDLRFIIVDEVHVFMGSERGRQVQCLIERLERLAGVHPRRIGLSATLKDCGQAADWLRAGSERPVIAPEISESGRTIRLAVEHFGEGESFDSYYRYLFETSRGRKCLIFADTRAETEAVIASLRRIAERERLPDVYHVHHGSISAPLREAAERAIKEEPTPTIVAATVTMELGMDIGQLERIVQMGAPHSVTSFVQRLGRSGRRGNPSEMWLVSCTGEGQPQDTIAEAIPWALLQNVAIIQLYVEERWLEPVRPARYPFSLLYHQTMSVLAGAGELSPAALAQQVLTLPPFRHTSADDYRALLRHLLALDHVQRTEEGNLIVGLAGEPVVRNFRFYAVFPDVEEYSVRDEGREIGSIVTPPPVGERFALAGFTWEVQDVDWKRKLVIVRQAKGKASIAWDGKPAAVHTRVLLRMRQALLADEEMYPYLQEKARDSLARAREMAQQAGLGHSNLLHLGDRSYLLFPWLGTVAFHTLERLLRFRRDEWPTIASAGGLAPYYMTIELAEGGRSDLLNALAAARDEEVAPEALLHPDEAPQLQKYDPYLPGDLLRKAFAADHLDVGEVRRELKVT